MNTRPVIVNNEPEIIGNYYMSKRHVEIGDMTLPIVDIDNNNQSSKYAPVVYPERPSRVMALRPDANAPKIHCIDIDASKNNTDDVTWRITGVIQGIIVYKFKFYNDSIIAIGAEMPEIFNAPGFIGVFRPELATDDRVLYKGFWGNIEIEEILHEKDKFIIDGVDYTAYNSSFICCGTNERFADEYRIRRKSIMIVARRDSDPYAPAESHFKKMTHENIVKIISVNNPDSEESVLSAIDELLDYRFRITSPLSSYIFGFSRSMTKLIRDALVRADSQVFSHIHFPQPNCIIFSKDALEKKASDTADTKVDDVSYSESESDEESQEEFNEVNDLEDYVDKAETESPGEDDLE